MCGNVTGSPIRTLQTDTHTHANSSATGATGRAGVPSSAQEGMCHTDDHLAYVKLCALNTSALLCPLPGSVSRWSVSAVARLPAAQATWEVVGPSPSWKSRVVPCAICCVGCPPPASPGTDALGSPRAAPLRPPRRARHP